ncbi:MAG TPA: TRAP transporter small permease, partial [Tianweitania sediminis]|nr:TRAP transporter small permease [Tianweitania sediminis]
MTAMRFWKSVGVLEWWLAAAGAGSMLFIMMMVTVISVAGRYFLHMDLIPGAYNIVERVIFPLLVFWGLPLAHREGMFPRLETLADTQPPRRRAFLAAFVTLVEVGLYAVFLWYVTKFTWASFASGRTMQIGASYLPLWPVLVPMPLAVALMLLEMGR